MAVTQLLYPTVVDVKRVDQVLMPLQMKDFAFTELFPMAEVNAAVVEWWQRDDYTGLMDIRGLDGPAPRVVQKAENRFEMEPMVAGNHMIVSEREVTRRAESQGSLFRPVDVRDLVMDRSEQLLHLQVALMMKMSWDLIVNGIFTGYGLNGQVAWRTQYQQQTYTPAYLWSDTTNSTPIADMRAMKLLQRGKSTNFGPSAKQMMSQKTFNYLVANRNQADLYGIRTGGLSGAAQGQAIAQNLNSINEVLVGEGLPQIAIFDKGYKDSTGAFQLFIPDGKVQWLGVRDNGAPLGRWAMTRNAWNPGQAPGPYYKIIEGVRPGVDPPLEIHRGFNGGIELHYPGSLITATVA